MTAYAVFNKTGEFLIAYPIKGMAENYQCRMGGLAKYTTIKKIKMAIIEKNK